MFMAEADNKQLCVFLILGSIHFPLHILLLLETDKGQILLLQTTAFLLLCQLDFRFLSPSQPHHPTRPSAGQCGSFPCAEGQSLMENAQSTEHRLSAPRLSLGACTFTIPAWKDMNPLLQASVPLFQGHLGLA